MVIVSWNMAKSRSIPFEEVLRHCENWEASVVVIQEPTGSLLNFGSRDKAAQPRGCELEWRGRLQQGGSQGSIVILFREGVSISNMASVDLRTAQGTRRLTPTNPLVVFDAREGTESMRGSPRATRPSMNPLARSTRAMRSTRAASGESIASSVT